MAGRTDEDENEATGARKREQEIKGRVTEGLDRDAEATTVFRRGTISPTENAERRVAGREVERNRRPGC